MSTRCQIGFYEHQNQPLNEPDVLLYVGSDGRPDFIIHQLIDSLHQLDEDKQLEDIETCSAKVLYDMMQFKSRHFDKSYKSFGISESFHGDISYFYAVYTSGIIKAFSIKNLGLLCETGKGVRTLRKVNFRDEPKGLEWEDEKERKELHATIRKLLAT